LSKVESMEMPVAVAARDSTEPLLSRMMRSVLEALQESRRRAARRMIEGYRRQCGE
jgi:hypothetical protein